MIKVDDEVLFKNPGHPYSHREAIERGALVDVSEMAQKVGFSVPVAVTITVWDRYIEWTKEDILNQAFQDTRGRLWNILVRLKNYLYVNEQPTAEVIFELPIIPRNGKSAYPKRTLLKAVIGKDDNSDLSVTIMLPTEDWAERV